MVKKVNNPLGPGDQKDVPSSTVGDGSAERSAIVVVTLGDLSEFFVVEGSKGLESSPVTAVSLVATDPVSRSSH